MRTATGLGITDTDLGMRYEDQQRRAAEQAAEQAGRREQVIEAVSLAMHTLYETHKIMQQRGGNAADFQLLKANIRFHDFYRNTIRAFFANLKIINDDRTGGDFKVLLPWRVYMYLYQSDLTWSETPLQTLNELATAGVLQIVTDEDYEKRPRRQVEVPPQSVAAGLGALPLAAIAWIVIGVAALAASVAFGPAAWTAAKAMMKGQDNNASIIACVREGKCSESVLDKLQAPSSPFDWLKMIPWAIGGVAAIAAIWVFWPMLRSAADVAGHRVRAAK